MTAAAAGLMLLALQRGVRFIAFLHASRREDIGGYNFINLNSRVFFSFSGKLF